MGLFVNDVRFRLFFCVCLVELEGMVSKKNKETSSISGNGHGLKDGMKHTILAIMFFALGIFLFLSSRNLAGPIGRGAYSLLSYLFGKGFYLLPLISILLALSLLRSSRPRIVTIRLMGMISFIISGLGLIELFFHNKTAGIVGWAVATTGEKLIGKASWLLFVTGLLISIVLIFETSFSLPKLLPLNRHRKNDRDIDLPSDGVYEESDAEVADDKDPDYEEQIVEPKIATASKLPFRINKQIEDEFMPLVRADVTPYVPPPLDLLGRDSGKPAAGDIKANSNIIKRTLSNFGIEVEMDEISIGPSITRYAL